MIAYANQEKIAIIVKWTAEGLVKAFAALEAAVAL
jgi:hypothetical protein